jgi:hypothetical protein
MQSFPALNLNIEQRRPTLDDDFNGMVICNETEGREGRDKKKKKKTKKNNLQMSNEGCSFCFRCIGRDEDAESRRARYRFFMFSLLGNEWLSAGHADFFFMVVDLARGAATFAQSEQMRKMRAAERREKKDNDEEDESSSSAIDTEGERQFDRFTELMDCGLLEMCSAVLYRVVGLGQEKGWTADAAWQLVRPVFVARYKNPASLFAKLDELSFRKIVKEATKIDNPNDRSYLDRKWLAVDRNALIPALIIRMFGSVVQLPGGLDKFTSSRFAFAMRPFLLGAMTTVEAFECMRVFSLTVVPRVGDVPQGLKNLKQMWSDRAVVRRVVDWVFEGANYFYRHVYRDFFADDADEVQQPAYFRKLYFTHGGAQGVVNSLKANMF